MKYVAMYCCILTLVIEFRFLISRFKKLTRTDTETDTYGHTFLCKPIHLFSITRIQNLFIIRIYSIKLKN